MLYHVLGLRAFSTDLSDGLSATTLSNGATFAINVTANGVTITDGDSGTDDANITSVNVLGTNGVIHVMDNVILPPSN